MPARPASTHRGRTNAGGGQRPVTKRRVVSRAWPEWSLQEIRLIEQHYGHITRADLVARYLPGRTIKGLEHMAGLLGLCKPRKVPDMEWTADKLDLLRRHYGTMPTSDLKRRYFPSSSIQAIAHRARRLGLRAKEPAWTRRELNLVRRYHGALPNPTLAARYLPQRSANAIQGCARKLGLTRATAPIWSAREVALLRAHYPHLPIGELIARYLPNRSTAAVRARIVLLGLTEHVPRPWRPGERAAIRCYYEMPDGMQRLVSMLDRPAWSIGRQARRFGLSRAGKAWTKAQDARLRRLYPLHGTKTVIPPHPPRSVIVRAQKLGLRRRPGPPPGSRSGQPWTADERKILETHRTHTTSALLPLLPRRTLQAISQARSVFGVKHKVSAASGPGSPWSMAEIAVLHANPTLTLAALSALLPGRSIKSIAVARWRALTPKQRTRDAPT